MSRDIKKVLYGIFYLLVLGLIVFGFSKKTIAPAPSCLDNKQNQEETGVDCGGPCILCEIKSLEPPRAIGDVKILSSNSGTVLLGQIQNSNSNYGVRTISYKFKLYGKSGNLIQTISGGSLLYPEERKFILERVNNLKEIPRNATLELSDPVWIKSALIVRPNLSLTEINTEITGDKVIVSGVLGNKSPFTVSNVKILIVLFDKLGLEFFASFTNLDVGGFADKPFSLPFPSDPNIIKNIDSNKTQIYANSQ